MLALYALSLQEFIITQARSVSSQSEIAIYWPGMHNTAFIVVFTDLREWGSFDNVVICTQIFSKTQKKNISMFSPIIVV